MKIIVLLAVLNTVNDINKRRIGDIVNKGHDVEVWSLEQICYPNKWCKKEIQVEEFEVYVVKEKKQLKKMLLNNKDALFFDHLGEGSIEKRWIRLQLKKYKCKYYLFFANPIPYIAIEKNEENCKSTTHIHSLVKELTKRIVELGLCGCVNVFIKRMEEKYQYIMLKQYQPNAVFLSTNMNERSIPSEYKKAKKVLTHSYDYEECLNQSSKLKVYGENYIVFVDVAATHHPDFKYKNIELYDTEEKIRNYYKLINHFFDVVERSCGKRVIIAAHPRSNYKGDEFEGREICMKQTRMLIENADLVLTYSSTALNFVSIYEKPFVLICDKQYIKYDLNKSYFYALEKLFQTKILFVEEIDGVIWEDYIVDEKDKFEEYKYNYIIDESVDKNKKMWDIVFDEINR